MQGNSILSKQLTRALQADDNTLLRLCVGQRLFSELGHMGHLQLARAFVSFDMVYLHVLALLAR